VKKVIWKLIGWSIIAPLYILSVCAAVAAIVSIAIITNGVSLILLIIFGLVIFGLWALHKGGY